MGLGNRKLNQLMAQQISLKIPQDLGQLPLVEWENSWPPMDWMVDIAYTPDHSSDGISPELPEASGGPAVIVGETHLNCRKPKAFPPWVFQEAFALNLSHKTSAARGVDVVGLVDYRVPGHVWQILVNQWLVSEALVAQNGPSGSKTCI
jgi:hypothetical protein